MWFDWCVVVVAYTYGYDDRTAPPCHQSRIAHTTPFFFCLSYSRTIPSFMFTTTHTHNPLLNFSKSICHMSILDIILSMDIATTFVYVKILYPLYTHISSINISVCVCICMCLGNTIPANILTIPNNTAHTFNSIRMWYSTISPRNEINEIFFFPLLLLKHLIHLSSSTVKKLCGTEVRVRGFIRCHR